MGTRLRPPQRSEPLSRLQRTCLPHRRACATPRPAPRPLELHADEPEDGLDTEQLLANAGERMEQFFVVPKVGHSKSPIQPIKHSQARHKTDSVLPPMQEAYFHTADGAGAGSGDASSPPPPADRK